MDVQTYYQHGTLEMLAASLFDGTISVSNLKKAGNYAIGTGHGLDGELIMLNNKCYKINHLGKAEELPADFMIPFANSHFGNFENIGEFSNQNLNTLLHEISSAIKGANIFFSLLITGEFKTIRTRSIDPFEPPYPDFMSAAKQQVEFFEKDIKGTLLTYHAPQIFQGATVAGFHSHFLSDDLEFGGHVLSAEIAKVIVEVQIFSDFKQHLPIEDETFRNKQLKVDNLAALIEEVEG